MRSHALPGAPHLVFVSCRGEIAVLKSLLVLRKKDSIMDRQCELRAKDNHILAV